MAHGRPQGHFDAKSDSENRNWKKLFTRTQTFVYFVHIQAQVSDGGFTSLQLACAAWRESDIYQSTLRVRGHWDIADLPNLTLAWKMHQSNTETG
jgi:hypothetical protein